MGINAGRGDGTHHLYASKLCLLHCTFSLDPHSPPELNSCSTSHCAPHFVVQSLCPSILGHELVKAGLLLALCGGVRKGVGEANRVPTRGDVHILVVGDPGMGKSQMLQVWGHVTSEM